MQNVLVIPFFNRRSWIMAAIMTASGLVLYQQGYDPQTLRSFEVNIGASMRRLIARLEDGLIGLVPEGAVAGDRVALLEGGKVPVVIRQCESSSDWRIIGEAYIHGVMYGEAFRPDKSHPISIR
jgi:hypothetical protein